MIKRDCFGLNLKTNCKKGDCKWYKTREQFAEDAKKAKKINRGRKLRGGAE